ncbi:hypothetical protein ACN38_g6633 [Penicillium nordicum]|uniref:Uncharacterized protein n=1 Tax=Penicillium nordicum TaxID=229535 RepID=A0A0N0RYP4_9EURO|nr:hypothetical protein ACN38_g6633 [Penicillium nordicum]
MDCAEDVLDQNGRLKSIPGSCQVTQPPYTPGGVTWQEPGTPYLGVKCGRDDLLSDSKPRVLFLFTWHRCDVE